MKLDRKKVKISQTVEYVTEDVELKKEAALAFVWDLTEEIHSLSGKFDAKSRLQRNVVSITRK